MPAFDPTSHQQTVQQDKQYLWHPFTPIDEWMDPQYDPVVIVRGKGSQLWDSQGNIYLDGNASIWTNLHGHNHPVINQAIHDQLEHIAHSSALGLTNPLAAELGEKLAQLASYPSTSFPSPHYRVFFSDDGSTAIECALKMAWQFFQQNGQSQRQTFVSLSGSYHGDTIGSMSLGKSGFFHEPYRPLLFPTQETPSPHCYRCPQRSTCSDLQDAHLHCVCPEQQIEAMEAIFKKQGDAIVAVVIEPRVQGAAGMIMHPPGYLKKVATLAKKYGALLILDEVMTGFGRTGRMLAAEHEDVHADFIALAKGLTGGYLPLGATLVRHEIFEGFRGSLHRTFFHGHSYCGNQLGCAAALANLKLFEQNHVLSTIQDLSTLLHQESRLFWKHPAVGDVRQEGLILAVELVQNRQTREPFPPEQRLAYSITERARHLGLLTRGVGHILFLLPPYSTTPSQLHSMVQKLWQALCDILPPPRYQITKS